MADSIGSLTSALVGAGGVLDVAVARRDDRVVVHVVPATGVDPAATCRTVAAAALRAGLAVTSLRVGVVSRIPG